MPTARCAKCQREWSQEELDPIENLYRRIHPDDEVPPGQCRYCGALCRLIEQSPAPAPDAGRIQITGWRAFNDDDDSVSIDVFAAQDTTTPHDLLSEQWNIDFEASDYSSCIEGKKPGFTNFIESIIDGQILTSHDGRQFMVSIREVPKA